ncbi:hypothetical protein JZ751_022367 [Albula glossodonta]|uniref:C-type lectin domain-containing protein n=1 Tax=Albula glossodonta TaxID=121402 RepID=A0A8T2MR92_9TELE|nr:hypothetical protein JZ751_023705 [Albula glossodonta]KAG9339862.1 hypothetical protein JZ751_022367 [Albula glossodonta]
MEMSDVIYANVERVRNIKSKTTPDQNPPNSPGEQHTDNGVLNDTMEKHRTLSETLNQLQTNYSSLTAERDQLQTNYSSLIVERDQLQTNNSSRTAERDQLLTNYRGLMAKTDQLHTNYNRLAAERDRLLTEYNRVTAQRDQLQSDYRSVIAEKGLGHLCPPGWTKFSSSCYYVSRDRKTWSDSRQYCRDREADLMYFTVFRILWIGLTDSDEEGTWKWVDGTTLTTGYWRSGEPNDSGSGEDCAVMYPDGWNDLPCSNKAYWVCEKPAP